MNEREGLFGENNSLKSLFSFDLNECVGVLLYQQTFSKKEKSSTFQTKNREDDEDAREGDWVENNTLSFMS